MKKSKRLFFVLGSSLLLAGCFSFSLWAKNDAVTVKTTREGGYYLSVSGKPFLMKGVVYNPVPPGKGYDWNFFSDPSKPWLIDGPMMKEAGINCVRIYSAGSDLEKTKEFMRDMYDKFGIYTVVSDWLGLWSTPSANYSDPAAQEKIKKDLLKIVEALKDEKGLLGWILGNENNYTFSGKIGFWTSPEIEALPTAQEKVAEKARIYYTFVNSLARAVKKIDKKHPVALGNGEATFLNIAAPLCPDVDALALIIYRGKRFGNFFDYVRSFFDKPIFLSEFGCDSYDAKNNTPAQQLQADFLLSQCKDLYRHTVFSGNLKGNALGGIIFEWIDEWWKHNEGYRGDWAVHNTQAGWSDGSYYFDIEAPNGMNMNEEWFGLVAYDEKSGDYTKRLPKESLAVIRKFYSSVNTSLPK